MQKVDLVAHNLADLTARKADCNGDATRTCLSAADVQDIFNAGAVLMSSLPTGSLEMTISEIGILQGAQGRRVETSWSITRNGQMRACGVTPVVPGDFTTATAQLGAIIIADITYKFSPGF